jgi:hypothetical protein
MPPKSHLLNSRTEIEEVGVVQRIGNFMRIGENTCRKDQRRALLGRGFAPPGLEEDGPAVVAVASQAAGKDGGT